MNDPALRARLQALGVDAETAHLVGLLPLVQVAWADGTVQDGERRAILERAATMSLGGHGAQLVEGWLTWRPSPAYFARGSEVLRALIQKGSASGTDLRTACERVADAAGGVFGRFGRVSADERRVIDEVVGSLGHGHDWESWVDEGYVDDPEDERTEVGVPFGERLVAPGPGIAPPCLEVSGGQVVALRGPVSVGRQADNEVALPADKMVSRRHCRFVVEERVWTVLDCGSVNGTWVGDERITGRRLFGGESVRVGDTLLRVRL